MNHASRHLIAAACLALTGFAAGAQPAPAGPGPGTGMPGHAAMMQDRMAHMQQRIAARDTALKQILQITPAQEGAWDAWVAARHTQRPQRPAPGEFAQLTTPQRLDRMRELRAERNAAMDRRADATKTFYAALTPSQQKAFDALAARQWQHAMGARHGGWMRERG